MEYIIYLLVKHFYQEIGRYYRSPRIWELYEKSLNLVISHGVNHKTTILYEKNIKSTQVDFPNTKIMITNH